jgi:hypothetical protein
VTFVQRALHPYRVVDRGFLEANPTRPAGTSGQVTWPPRVPRYRADSRVSRSIEMFNGGLSGRVLGLQWQARWDAPDGELLIAGRIGPVEIEPGFHTMRTVEFPLPQTSQRERALYLVLDSLQGDKSLFQEAGVYFLVLPASTTVPESSARFIGLDEKTRGNWRGKYGHAGHEVVGVATSLPADVRVDWGGANTYTWAAKTDDPRAPASTDSARVAACRYAGEIELEVELPAPGARLSLYFVDWDRTRAKQPSSFGATDARRAGRRDGSKPCRRRTELTARTGPLAGQRCLGWTPISL